MKLELYEWLMIVFATCFIALGSYFGYNGEDILATKIFANGAMLFSFFGWCELRWARRRIKEKNNE